MLAFIYAIVVWMIVPFIIFSLLMLSLIIISSIKDANNKVSAAAGLGTGLMLFIIYVIIQLQITENSEFNIKFHPNFDVSLVVPLLIGFVIGFCLLWMVATFLPTRLIGLIVLILSATSATGLFTYYFTTAYKDIVLFAALGTIVGLLFRLMFFPASLQTIDLDGTILGVKVFPLVTLLTGILTLTNLVLAIISLF